MFGFTLGILFYAIFMNVVHQVRCHNLDKRITRLEERLNARNQGRRL